MSSHHRLIIIGSGPAAFTAAVYASRADIAPLVFEGKTPTMTPGGQLTTTTDIENFPGFPDGIDGFKLVDDMKRQCIKFGSTVITEIVTDLETSRRPFKITATNGKTYSCDSVIIATGATAKLLEFPGSKQYWNNGISACAVCDGALPIFRKKQLLVIGGGDSACEEATFLTKFASKVFMIVRRDVLRASKIMQQRVTTNDKIEILWDSAVAEVTGDEKTGLMTHAKVVSTKVPNNGQARVIEASGLFFAVGHVPGTQFLNGQLKTDPEGYIITKPGTTETSVEGIFAAGDVQDRMWRQAITAAGTGCMSALQAEHFLTAHQSSASSHI